MKDLREAALDEAEARLTHLDLCLKALSAAVRGRYAVFYSLPRVRDNLPSSLAGMYPSNRLDHDLEPEHDFRLPEQLEMLDKPVVEQAPTGLPLRDKTIHVQVVTGVRAAELAGFGLEKWARMRNQPPVHADRFPGLVCAGRDLTSAAQAVISAKEAFGQAVQSVAIGRSPTTRSEARRNREGILRKVLLIEALRMPILVHWPVERVHFGWSPGSSRVQRLNLKQALSIVEPEEVDRTVETSEWARRIERVWGAADPAEERILRVIEMPPFPIANLYFENGGHTDPRTGETVPERTRVHASLPFLLLANDQLASLDIHHLPDYVPREPRARAPTIRGDVVVEEKGLFRLREGASVISTGRTADGQSTRRGKPAPLVARRRAP